MKHKGGNIHVKWGNGHATERGNVMAKFQGNYHSWQKFLDDIEVLPENQGFCWLHAFREEWAVKEKDLGKQWGIKEAYGGGRTLLSMLNFEILLLREQLGGVRQ